MKQAAVILTLIGAILQMVGHTIAIFATFGVWLIGAAIFVPLTWIARNKTIQGSKGWAIYGIVQSVLLFDLVSLVGYILHVVDLSTQKQEQQATLEQ
jgi:hypothetical protein